MLKDTHNRLHDYLRISLTDSCNLRCSYCMPHEAIQCLPSGHLMQPLEIQSIAETFIGLGVTKIRLTGGEPLVRRGFPEILERLSKLPATLTITTNAILIDQYIRQLKGAGIISLNVSLDTLRPERFHTLTKRNQWHHVWKNITLLLEQGFSVKINVVLMRGVNDDEVLDFLELTKAWPLHVRFIEYMPFDKNGWDKNKVVPTAQVLARIFERYDCVKLKDEKHATARKYKVVGHLGTFAFITTMSQPFCSDCNRMRITADGKMKNCLFGKDEIDILAAHRRGEAIEPLIRKSLFMKHEMMGGQFARSYLQTDPKKLENRSMIKIGG